MSIIINLLIVCCGCSIVYFFPFLQPSRNLLPIRRNPANAIMEPFSLVINAFISLFLLALSGMIVISQSLTGVLVICVAMVIVGFLLILLGKDRNKVTTQYPKKDWTKLLN
jgi:ABC-type protease/lipase transport system fused ATPase/permease subunit